MKKRNLLLITLLVVAVSMGIIVPAFATGTDGCTPGYWKQEHHFDSWVGYSPDDDFHAVFLGYGPNITLLDALKAKNKDYPSGEAAFLRHAVAALLNADYSEANPGHMEYALESWVINAVQCQYGGDNEYCRDGVGFEEQKDEFECRTSSGCPLD